MKISILGHRELVQRAFQNTPPNLIFISNPQHPFIVERSEEAVNKVPNKLILLFDDVLEGEDVANVPNKNHIKDALQFSEGINDLVVSCRMGVSRSAAVAFAIMIKHVGIVKAFEFLDSQRHSPNAVIIKHTQELFDLPYLNETMTAWKSGNKKEFEYYLAEHFEALNRREKLRKGWDPRAG